MERDAGNQPDGSCVKRIALRSPMQCAAMAHAVRCDGCCTALRHSAEDTDVGQGAPMAFIFNRPPALANHFPSVRPILFAPRLLSLGKIFRAISSQLREGFFVWQEILWETGERVEAVPAWAWILWGGWQGGCLLGIPGCGQAVCGSGSLGFNLVFQNLIG